MLSDVRILDDGGPMITSGETGYVDEIERLRAQNAALKARCAEFDSIDENDPIVQFGQSEGAVKCGTFTTSGEVGKRGLSVDLELYKQVKAERDSFAITLAMSRHRFAAVRKLMQSELGWSDFADEFWNDPKALRNFQIIHDWLQRNPEKRMIHRTLSPPTTLKSASRWRT